MGLGRPGREPAGAIAIALDSPDPYGTRYWLASYHVLTWELKAHLWFFFKYFL